MKKVYVIGNAVNYAEFLKDFELTNDSKSADLIILTGGEDVSPELYEEDSHPHTGNNPVRDASEINSWNKIKQENPDVLTMGICRGSQLGCVLSGGKLVQHMNHPYMHKVSTPEGKDYEVTSTHHQMQYPFNLNEKDYEIKAYCKITGSTYAEGVPAGMEKPPVDPEIVFYNKTKILAIQGHPEMVPNSEFALEVNNLVNSLI
jgi:gamma-glutamyl-gamma-aminobutyrate hydrolase PuuD